jgi:hypothetical protein
MFCRAVRDLPVQLGAHRRVGRAGCSVVALLRRVGATRGVVGQTHPDALDQPLRLLLGTRLTPP